MASLSTCHLGLWLGWQILLNLVKRSHRVGPKLDQQDRVRSRPIIVRFKSENTRDAVLKARFRLKEHNEQHRDARIYINKDLTVPP